MGEMADLAYEQAMREEFDGDGITIEEAHEVFLAHISDPFIWTRSDHTKKHIRDLNGYHIGNVLRYIETQLKGYKGRMPRIYFNLIAEAKRKGVGLTDVQIQALVDEATRPEPALFSAFDREIDYERYNGTILRLEEEDDEVSLVVVDGDGCQEYKILTFKSDGKAHLYSEIPKDSKIQNENGTLKFELT